MPLKIKLLKKCLPEYQEEIDEMVIEVSKYMDVLKDSMDKIVAMSHTRYVNNIYLFHDRIKRAAQYCSQSLSDMIELNEEIKEEIKKERDNAT